MLTRARRAPLIVGDHVIIGVGGDLDNLPTFVRSVDAETGKMLWKQLFNDFLSDVVYLRYANSSPTIDSETGKKEW